MDAYVRRLVGAGVAALGFGLEPYFDAVPDAVVRGLPAAQPDARGRPRAPSRSPPSAWNSPSCWNRTTPRLFRQLADTNRQLMRAVLSARPEHELLAALVQRVPVWASPGRRGRAGARPRLRRRSGAGALARPRMPAALQPLLARLLSGSGPRVELDSLRRTAGSALVFGHPLRSTRDANLGRAGPGHRRAADPGPEQRRLHRRRAAGTAGAPAHQRLTGPQPAGHGAAAASGERGLRTAPGNSTGSRTCWRRAFPPPAPAQLRVVQGIRAAQGLDARGSTAAPAAPRQAARPLARVRSGNCWSGAGCSTPSWWRSPTTALPPSPG